MSEFLTKEIYVRGESVTVHSLDGFRWFSNQTEAEEACQKRREAFLAEEQRLLKKHATFRHGETRPIGRVKG